jgi:hypothetical protein
VLNIIDFAFWRRRREKGGGRRENGKEDIDEVSDLTSS